jgi:hypothetical protein
MVPNVDRVESALATFAFSLVARQQAVGPLIPMAALQE